MKSIEEFLTSSIRNAWLTLPHIHVYVRKGFHIGTDNEPHRYIDIANITVDQEMRGKGIGRRFILTCQLAILERRSDDLYGVYYENIVDADAMAFVKSVAKDDLAWTIRGCNAFWEPFKVAL